MPESPAPESPAPESPAPESSAPESSAPESSAPAAAESAQPDPNPATTGQPGSADQPQVAQVIVVGPDGQPIGTMPAEALSALAAGNEEDSGKSAQSLTDQIEQPAKVMRIGSMVRQLLEEVKSAPLDEASRIRLKEIHASSIKELESGLAPELVEELERLSLPFTEEGAPSESELRIAQAQLVGWLEGLFHGIQTAIYAQQMATRAQFEQARRALPPGPMIPGAPEQAAQQPPASGETHGGGMYL